MNWSALNVTDRGFSESTSKIFLNGPPVFKSFMGSFPDRHVKEIHQLWEMFHLPCQANKQQKQQESLQQMKEERFCLILGNCPALILIKGLNLLVCSSVSLLELTGLTGSVCFHHLCLCGGTAMP